MTPALWLAFVPVLVYLLAGGVVARRAYCAKPSTRGALCDGRRGWGDA